MIVQRKADIVAELAAGCLGIREDQLHQRHRKSDAKSVIGAFHKCDDIVSQCLPVVKDQDDFDGTSRAICVTLTDTMNRTPPTGPTPQFTLRLDRKTREELEKEALSENRSLGNHIKTILANHVGYDGPLGDDDQTSSDNMSKKRAHITIEQTLFEEASIYARQVLRSDFTGLVIRLIVDELRQRGYLVKLTEAERIIAEATRRGDFPPSAPNSSLDKIAADQKVHHEEVGAKPRDAGGKGRASGRTAQATAGRARR